MKITLELLIKKGLDLETAIVILDLVQLYEYDNQNLTKKGLNKIIEKLGKKK